MIETLPVGRLDEAHAVWRELHRHHSEIAVPAGWQPRDEDAAWRAWRAAAASALGGSGQLFVHRQAADIDGLALVVMLAPARLVRPVLTASGPLAELDTLAVAPEVRSGGVGTALYAAAAAWARDHNAVAMQIGVRATNAAALRFYERQGARAAFVSLVQPL